MLKISNARFSMRVTITSHLYLQLRISVYETNDFEFGATAFGIHTGIAGFKNYPWVMKSLIRISFTQQDESKILIYNALIPGNPDIISNLKRMSTGGVSTARHRSVIPIMHTNIIHLRDKNLDVSGLVSARRLGF